MSRIPVVIWTILRVAAAVLFVGWAALRLLALDGVFGLSVVRVCPVGKQGFACHCDP